MTALLNRLAYVAYLRLPWPIAKRLEPLLLARAGAHAYSGVGR